MAEPGPRREPGPLARALGGAVNSAVARFPWSWRLFSGPARRFFDSVAVGWDESVRSDSPEYLEPLVAALDRLEASPGRCRKPFPVQRARKSITTRLNSSGHSRGGQ
jgi:hypothetical protein